MWTKYKNMIVFIMITAIGINLYIFDFGWKIYNMLGAATTLALSVLALMTYIDYAKGEDVIKIYFKLPAEESDNRKIYTKLYTQRKHFTRGEVLGLLRMIQTGQGQFTIEDFNKNPKILKRFEEIQNGISDELIIEITQTELKQFNVLM